MSPVSANVRSRLTPTLAAFVLLVVTTRSPASASYQTSNPGQVLFLYFAFAFSAVLLALAVAYGVIRHRVIDVNFIVGRTLVYTVLTVFAVSIFTLIEYLRETARTRRLGDGPRNRGGGDHRDFARTPCTDDWDKFIDVVLFRRRHLAEARLERVAATLPHAASGTLVEEMLVAEPADALDLGFGSRIRVRRKPRMLRRSIGRGRLGRADTAEVLDGRRSSRGSPASRTAPGRRRRSSLAAFRSADRHPGAAVRRTDCGGKSRRGARTLRRPHRR